METESPRYRIALDDFKRARRKAAMQEIYSKITGQPNALISFEDARQRLKPSGEEVRGLKKIPLKAIIGSVGRYADFNRNFLPRKNAQSFRWVSIKSGIRDLDEMPPIDVYQIGEAYFVIDGNHRVSIARERKLTHISAYVIEIKTKVPLTPETDFNELILKSEYTDFLAKTKIDENCPPLELRITAPGRYKILEEDIEFHQNRINAKNDEPISFEEATCLWYKDVYLPAVKFIQNRGILRAFPKRTETDLYAWIVQYQEKLHDNLGWWVNLDVVTTDFVDMRGAGIKRRFSRMIERIRSIIIPPMLAPGPEPGKWRERQLVTHDEGRLFTHILVPFNGKKESWQALEQAIQVAKREKSNLLGLHIVAKESEKESDFVKSLANQFETRCEEAGLVGEFAVDVGGVASTISTRARWSDLVVIYMAHPPQSQISSRISSGIRSLIQHCPRPILTVHPTSQKLERFLVAYDGSPKSKEALYMAAYFAGRWEGSLVVLTIAPKSIKSYRIVHQAKVYLESQNIAAKFVRRDGSVAESILDVVKEEKADLILMGGYSRKPVAEVILGSSLDEVLRKTQQPVFICR